MSMYRKYTTILRTPHGYVSKLLLIMKLTTFILMISLMQVSAATFGQSLTLREKTASIEKIFTEIRKQTGYGVVIENTSFKTQSRVNADFLNTPLSSVMDRVLTGTDLTYTINDKTIIITQKEKSIIDRIVDYFLAIDVTGRVVDEKGEPIAGASIKVKGTSVSVIADGEGKFLLKGVEENATLEISVIGYKVREVKVAKELGDVRMEVSVGNLEEVAVVNTGYQSLPKERATGSFTQIDNELLNRSVSTNVIDRILDVSSGLNLVGNPAGTGKINQSFLQIRGISTINANQRPLIVIDGFPYDESFNYTNLVNNLNPNDVESITLLKDAAAASIWGSRSGNGVIVITTKKGKYNQKASFNVNSNFSLGERPNMNSLPILNSVQWIDLEKTLFAKNVYKNAEDYSNLYNIPTIVIPQASEILIAKRDGKISSTEADRQLALLSQKNLYADVNQYLLRNSKNQQYNLNISGGGERFKYYTSYGLDKNIDSKIGNEYERNTLRFDNTYKLNKRIEINSYLAFTKSHSVNNSVGLGLSTAPYSSLKDENGMNLSIPYRYRSTFVNTIVKTNPNVLDWLYRPLDELENNDFSTEVFDARLGADLRYTVLEGLNLNLKYQYQNSISEDKKLYGKSSFTARDLINLFSYEDASGTTVYRIPKGSILSGQNTTSKSWNIRPTIDFNKTLSDHSIAAILGFEAREVRSNLFANRNYGYDEEFSTTGIVDYSTQFTNRVNSFTRIPIENNISQYLNRFTSYFANLSYTYKGKYTLSASARLDGSNFFGIEANKRIVPLTSIGGLWNIASENFYHIAWIPYLKLRLTYGYNGNTNNNASSFTTMQYLSPTYSQVGLISGNIQSPPNPNLSWEKVRMLNVGMDFALKNNKLDGSIEYYSKKGLDLIGPILVDATTGVTSYIGNKGSFAGNGIDLVLNSININDRVKWISNLLFNYNTDKVLSYDQPAISPSVAVQGNIVVGQPLYSLRGFKSASLDPINGGPRIFNNGIVTSYANYLKTTFNDITYFGTLAPKVFGSIRNSITYQKYSVSFNITYKLNYFFRRSSINYSGLLTGNSFNAHKDYLNRWQKAGDELVTTIPAMPSVSNTNYDFVYAYSESLIERGDHIRLQDIRLSYDLDKLSLGRAKIKSAQFFLIANNMGIIWRANRIGVDPDFGDGINGLLPPARTISFGLRLNL